MSKSSDKKSAFGLSGDQIGRLLSLGYGKDPDVAEPSSCTDTNEDKDAKGEVEGSEPSLQIDGYEIIDKIAEAGQGQVWRALQQSTGREVAVKVPRVGSVTSERARIRFEREVELAARLKHPNIARIYDSGVDRGQYYYVMDLVKGSNLDDYVRQHDLTHRQILELMRTICQAVQHAHQNGIIHRDLKPSNIIVTDDGRPFIVDFGLAKGFLEDDQNFAVSIDGEAVGTPAYMSPEQAAGHMDKVDTRTDVYSLGVTLFTLLTGSNPHDLSGSRLEVIHRIADDEVRRPRLLNPKIEKDIEALLLKALDKDPDGRYPSAAGLVQDIDNYLRGEPLIACSQSSLYMLKKFVRRHRTLVTGIAAVLMVLIAGIGVSTAFAVKANVARADSQAFADFLLGDVLTAMNPSRAIGEEITPRHFLDAVAKHVEDSFRDQPRVRASIYNKLSGVNGIAFGEYRLSLFYAERAYHIRRDELGEEPNPLQLALANSKMGRYKESEALFLKMKVFKTGSPFQPNGDIWPNVYSQCYGCLAILYFNQGRYKESQQILSQVWEPYVGRDVSWRPYYMGYLASALRYQGHIEEATRLCETIIEEIESAQKSGKVHPATPLAMSHIAELYMDQGDLEYAQELLVKSLEDMRRLWIAQHPHTLEFINSLAVLYTKQGNYTEAEHLFIEALEGRKNKLDENHPATLETKNDLAVLYIRQSDYDKAEPLLIEAVEGRRLKLGDFHRHTKESLNNLIDLYEAWGKPHEANEWRAKLPHRNGTEKEE